MNPENFGFEGEPEDQPAPVGRVSAMYEWGHGPRIVRHLAGYAPFATFVQRCGVSPGMLAADTTALIAFARSHAKELLQDPDLLHAGAIFFGNSLARRAPAARWRKSAEWPIEVVQAHGGPSFPVERVFPALLTAPEERLAELEEILREWDETEAVWRDARRRLALRTNPRWAPQPFITPAHWSAAADAALALIDYLQRHYEASAQESPELAAVFSYLPEDPHRVIRLAPSAVPGAASLTIAIMTTGVAVHTGALYEVTHLDEWTGGWQHITDVVLATAAGAFREAYPIGRRRFAGFAIGMRDGSAESGQGPVSELNPNRLAWAEDELAALPDGWEPWPLRQR